MMTAGLLVSCIGLVILAQFPAEFRYWHTALGFGVFCSRNGTGGHTCNDQHSRSTSSGSTGGGVSGPPGS